MSITPYTQLQAREAAAAEAQRRASNAAAANAQQAQVTAANNLSQQRQQQQYQSKIDSGSSEADANAYVSSLNMPSFSRTGNAQGGTSITATQGYDPATGFAQFGTTGGSSVQFDKTQNYTPSQQSLLQGIRQSYSNVSGTGVASTGHLQDSAIEQMRTAGFTDNQINQELENSKYLVSQVASNTGQGGSFSERGRYIPPSQGDIGGTGNIQQSKDQSRASQIAGISRTIERQMPGTDKNGNPIFQTITDPNYEKNVNDMKNRFATEDAAQAAGMRQFEQNNQPTAPAQSFLNSVPDSMKQQADNTFAPLFDYMNNQGKALDKGLQNGLSQIQSQESTTAKYVQDQQDRNDTMMQYFSGLNQKSLDHQLEFSKQQKDQEDRAANQERQHQDMLYDRAITDQVIQNEKNRKDQLQGLGISGGWRASRQTADVITALAKGDKIVSDLQADKAFSDMASSNKLLDISSKYTQNVITAYDKYDSANGVLFKSMMDEAGTIDKTIYESSKEKDKATADMVGKWLDGYGKLAGEFAKTTVDHTKFMITQAADLRKENADRYDKTYSQAMKWLDTKGTVDKGQLSIYEKSLGLLPGSLSDKQTLEEQRLNKARGIGALSGGDIRSMVEDERKRMKALYPYASAGDIDNLVYGTLYEQVDGGSAKGSKVEKDIYTYMNGQPIGGEKYRITPFSPTSSIGATNLKNINQRLSDQEYLSTSGPSAGNDLYDRLTDSSLPASERMSPADAKRYMSDLGYIDVPNHWFSNNYQKAK